MGSTTDPLFRRRATLQRLMSCERRRLLEAALVSRPRAELDASSGLIERLLRCTAAAAVGSYRERVAEMRVTGGAPERTEHGRIGADVTADDGRKRWRG